MAEARPGAVGHVQDRHRPPFEYRPNEVSCFVSRPVGSEPEVDGHHALVRYHVPGYAAADADGVEALVVAQPVDLGLTGRVPAQDVEHGGGLVDGIAAHPGARGVGPLARHRDLGAQRALAAALDLARARLHQHGEVAGQQVRAVAAQPQQPVAVGGDLLAVVEDVGDVPARLGQAAGQPQLHGHARFHVRGAAAVQLRAVEPRRQVARDRDGVGVPGQDDPLRAPQRRPGHDRVAVPVHAQVRQRRQRFLDLVGQ
jgi:hypothetical protein